MSDPLVVAAIDLGTYATGFAWAPIDEQNDDATQRRIHFFTQWPGQPVAAVKNLSALLLDEDDEVVAWGHAARQRALNHVRSLTAQRYRAAFKMQLMEPPTQSIPGQNTNEAEAEAEDDDGARAVREDNANGADETDAERSGVRTQAGEDQGEGEKDRGEEEDVMLAEFSPPSEAEILTTQLLAQVREIALEQVTASGYLEEDIRWGITVPAIFDDETKQKVRRAAVAAGLPAEDGRLILALEPEAAAHYARVSGARPPGEEEQARTDLAEPGCRLLIVDSGGGTVDLAAYENDEHGHMVERGVVNGGQHGSNELNQRFEDRLLADRFGKPELVTQLREEVPEAMLSLCEAWERGKLTFGPDTEDSLSLPIPTAIDRKLGAAVRKRLARRQRGITEDIVISPQEMRDLFDTVVPDILDLVDEQLAEVTRQDRRGAKQPVVLMVGGFSNSPYLQHALKNHLEGRARVLVPPDPGAAVLYGAVHFAYEPQTRARRARFTYGVGYTPKFVIGRDPESLRYTDSSGTARCYDRFSRLVTIGQLVDTGEAVQGVYFPVDGTQHELHFVLYASTEENPRYVTDPGCEKIGRVTVDIASVSHEHIGERGATLYLHFGETEIKARVVVNKSGEEAATTVHFTTDY